MRIAEHRHLADPARRGELARRIVVAKIDAFIAAARHYQRQGKGMGRVLAPLREAADRAAASTSPASLRGVEGTASAIWFQALPDLLRSPWTFPGRKRRPPSDPVNALLSLGYTLLTHRVAAKLDGRGFETALGALHEFRPGRPSLACDVVEPFRVPAVDRWMLALCNEGRVHPDDFLPEGPAVRLRPNRFAFVLNDWEAFWSAGRFDDQLETSFNELASHFRSALPPTPSNPLENRGGLGNDENDGPP